MKHRFLSVHPSDNVLVALTDLKAGESISYRNETITLLHDLPAKHKFATRDLNLGDEILMYGVAVGKAVNTIRKGSIITTQNVQHHASSYSLTPGNNTWSPPDVSKWKNRTFMGYHRDDGQVGVANYWLVIPLVFCENRNVDVIRQAFEEELGFVSRNAYKNYVRSMVELYRNNQLNEIRSLTFQDDLTHHASLIFRNIDGIKFLTHEGGCGGTRQDSEALCALLAGYIHNPNVAGATVLSLGCQHAQADILQQKLHKLNPSFSKPLILLEQQQEGTEQELLASALKRTFLALADADKQERKPASLSNLTIGLECGGSDGFSGISANPVVGYVSDLLAALGGSSILSEFPELCGVEQELINRCIDQSTAKQFITLMELYSRSAEAVGSGFDMNPSPGNIKDGLITDAMKSAGAAKKGGTSPISDVLDYGHYVTKPGLNLLCTPGNDVESTTAMAGAGANMILFTTGLGTPTGNPITPVVKISSNTRLAHRMPDIIDVNAGTIIEGVKTIEEVGDELMEFIIRVASGEARTKAMQLNQNDFIPWKRGVSL
jgi:altronate hydrolase